MTTVRRLTQRNRAAYARTEEVLDWARANGLPVTVNQVSRFANVPRRKWGSVWERLR